MKSETTARLKFLAEVVAAMAIDAAIMVVVYYLAYGLRLDFNRPVCGWRAVGWSAVVVVFIQLAILASAGLYRKNWSRFGLNESVRLVAGLVVACGIFIGLRWCLPELSNVRPPYTISIINCVLLSAALVSMRVLYRGYVVVYRHSQPLLGRPPVVADTAGFVDQFHGTCVMVTGAGGTIGSELCRQVLRTGPRKLILLERGENALYEINRHLRSLGGETEIVPQMTDICNLPRMEKIFAEHAPEIVIHAAAYKHVPMVEANPKEGIRNNLLATVELGRMSAAHGVKKFVFISTDKAVKPLSVMGITKRLSELALVGMNKPGGTVFCAVRFGNVLGSSGSVIPLFEEQVRNHVAVTVTHPDMKRYFMTVGEAVSLVLQAATLAKQGEIFVLDMGQPFKVVDIAEEVIRRAGFRPYVDVPIIFTGIRPGEKLFEELDVSEKSEIGRAHV